MGLRATGTKEGSVGGPLRPGIQDTPRMFDDSWSIHRRCWGKEDTSLVGRTCARDGKWEASIIAPNKDSPGSPGN